MSGCSGSTVGEELLRRGNRTKWVCLHRIRIRRYGEAYGWVKWAEDRINRALRYRDDAEHDTIIREEIAAKLATLSSWWSPIFILTFYRSKSIDRTVYGQVRLMRKDGTVVRFSFVIERPDVLVRNLAGYYDND